ncbi:hypothetical protein EDB84DRAFT_1672432 [Lactarius hengduanensis]|nr:hypothetical protein EDB84DRAFT_1672432 [Lactarius hengduanensis]
MNQGFVERAQNCLYAACKGVVYVIVSYTKVVALEHSADKTQEGYHKLKTESGASSTPLEGFGEPGVLRSQSQWCFVACSVHEVCLRGVWVTGYCGPMGYVHKIPAHRAGGRIRLWGIRGYGVSGGWDTRGSTVPKFSGLCLASSCGGKSMVPIIEELMHSCHPIIAPDAVFTSFSKSFSPNVIRKPFN